MTAPAPASTLTRVAIADRRLASQRLTDPTFKTPVEVVRTLGAVQAQDYAGAKWALGQRMRGVTDATIDEAFNEGAILRTHILRPTWHFVAPADIRWMLALTAPRVNAATAYYYRKLELDADVFRRTNAALTKALRDGKQRTRVELAPSLVRAGIDPKQLLRVSHVMFRAELDGVICSGARRGKQFTYALLEERVPAAPSLDRDEALLELTARYFTTRGPATTRDFSWWSGLTMADVKRGIEIAGRALEQAMLDGRAHWFSASAHPARAAASPTAYLLPNYDEYFIGFKDRSAMGLRAPQMEARGDALAAHILVIDGQVVGGWKRVPKKNAVGVELNLITRITPAEQRAVAAAAERYAAFLEVPVDVA